MEEWQIRMYVADELNCRTCDVEVVEGNNYRETLWLSIDATREVLQGD